MKTGLWTKLGYRPMEREIENKPMHREMGTGIWTEKIHVVSIIFLSSSPKVAIMHGINSIMLMNNRCSAWVTPLLLLEAVLYLSFSNSYASFAFHAN